MAQDPSKGVWIRDPAFSGLKPVDGFHKQLSPKALPPHPEGLKNRRMLLRKSFSLDRIDSLCVMDICADDSYKLYVNGEFVAEGPANSYHFRMRYDSVDLTSRLKKGENLIAVDVHYQGLVNRVWQSADLRQGLFAELRVGEELVLKSDSSWKMLVPQGVSGAVFGYQTQFAEDIDSRLWPQGWQLPGFDDSAWGGPDENMDDDHVLFPSEIPALTRYEVFPADKRELSKGRLLIDFGHEVVGYFSCEATGSSGQVVEIRHGEELDPATGGVRAMRCNCDYLDKWTLSGRRPDVLEYSDYKAFRYVELLVPDGVDIAKSRALARHYPMERGASRFESADGLLKGIWDICANAVKISSQTAFLDCPSREKGQYLGDLTVSAHSHMLLSGDVRLFAKALRDFADSAFICPGLMAVAPCSFMQEIADYSLQYPRQLLLHYRHSGDRDFLEGLMPAAEAMMAHFRKFEREDGLLENVRDKWNLVDWPDNLRDGYDFDLNPNGAGPGPHAVLNAFYAAALSAMDSLRAIFGLKREPEAFPRLKDAFIKAFHRSESGLFVDAEASSHSSLHSNAMALYAGLVPDAAVDKIVDFILGKGFCCGVYMAYFVLKGLARAGRHDVALRLLSSSGERSWGNMLKEGATSCFEAWGKDQKWNTSLCHPWASAPIPVFVEDFCGISPLKPGYKGIALEPRLEGVSDFELSLRLPTAKLLLKKRGDALALEAEPFEEIPLDFKAASGTRRFELERGNVLKTSFSL